jgi:hypothetical protein
MPRGGEGLRQGKKIPEPTPKSPLFPINFFSRFCLLCRKALQPKEALAIFSPYFLLLTQKKVTKKRVTWVFRDPLRARSLKKPSRSSPK